jgi:hypothetical protein
LHISNVSVYLPHQTNKQRKQHESNNQNKKPVHMAFVFSYVGQRSIASISFKKRCSGISQPVQQEQRITNNTNNQTHHHAIKKIYFMAKPRQGKNPSIYVCDLSKVSY